MAELESKYTLVGPTMVVSEEQPMTSGDYKEQEQGCLAGSVGEHVTLLISGLSSSHTLGMEPT